MEIDVVGYRSVEERGKQFYVYIIQTNVAGRSYKVEKRYSDLLALHKKLKKQLNTPAFPPKQIRNHDSKVLEARRIGLSNYFHVIAQGNLFTKTLLEFLDVHHFPANLDIAADSTLNNNYGVLFPTLVTMPHSHNLYSKFQ
ncbi:sorting nexin-24-like isoform X2 [Styela clava]|uniref:sorting nexin-24-like isoform X2 n=1 Tax=Styela clava TaxID=7725 RepID=UPI00193A5E94|nr:sorting nexin-24-like isoform X2 [Styela clava]